MPELVLVGKSVMLGRTHWELCCSSHPTIPQSRDRASRRATEVKVNIDRRLARNVKESASNAAKRAHGPGVPELGVVCTDSGISSFYPETACWVTTGYVGWTLICIVLARGI
uniref:Uncharacterized protein n=1 Tax=Ananas comosus var. bracteatus TaxID=296719 RepID=A0A6V7NYE4_ANACO|nr:unnamed protein product [Ananas comosus var. bracteatus]